QVFTPGETDTFKKRKQTPSGPFRNPRRVIDSKPRPALVTHAIISRAESEREPAKRPASNTKRSKRACESSSRSQPSSGCHCTPSTNRSLRVQWHPELGWERDEL